MTFTPDPAGMRALFDEIAGKIDAVDRSIRKQHTDSTVEDVERDAVTRFERIGVNFPSLREYAEAGRRQAV